MKKCLLAILPFVAGLALSAPAYADSDLKAAVDSDQRLERNTERDTWRHPYETLTFFGIQPDMTVVELTPGGGWYTEILAPYLREKGQYIAGVYNPESSRANYRRYAVV
ncbi:MAG TPA: methyltransferase, partial [Pusillimonas sp.]|nr:methyltransferase [Pusillimonas sp.]